MRLMTYASAYSSAHFDRVAPSFAWKLICLGGKYGKNRPKADVSFALFRRHYIAYMPIKKNEKEKIRFIRNGRNAKKDRTRNAPCLSNVRWKETDLFQAFFFSSWLTTSLPS